MADRSSPEARSESLCDMYDALTRFADAGGFDASNTARDHGFAICQALRGLAMLAGNAPLADFIAELQSREGL